MSLDALFTTAGTRSEDAYPTTVTYTPLGGSGSSVTMIFREEASAGLGEATGAVDTGKTAVAIVRTAQVAAPGRGDLVALNSITWRVESATVIAGSRHKLNLTADVRTGGG